MNEDNRCFAIATIQLLLRGDQRILNIFVADNVAYVNPIEPNAYEM